MKPRSRKTGSDGDGRREVTAGMGDVRRQSSSETYLGTLRYCFPYPIQRLMSPSCFSVRSTIVAHNLETVDIDTGTIHEETSSEHKFVVIVYKHFEGSKLSVVAVDEQ